ncbi:MAG: hypothetical protein Q9214_005691 [Letrouitia sp. 1 TL-2023]
MQLLQTVISLLFCSAATAVPVADSVSGDFGLARRDEPIGLVSRESSGYQGPGVYTLTYHATNLRADLYLGGSAPGTPINQWGSSGPYYNAHQYWQIADVGQGQVIIINNGTSTLFSVATGAPSGQAANCTGQAYPPWKPESRWIVETQGNYVIFKSVAYPNNVMDVLNPEQPFGQNTPVQAAPRSGTKDQQWVLQLHF